MSDHKDSIWGPEPKDTQRFWNPSKKLFRETATAIQDFVNERNNRGSQKLMPWLNVLVNIIWTLSRKKETLSQNHEVVGFQEASRWETSRTPIAIVRVQHLERLSTYHSDRQLLVILCAGDTQVRKMELSEQSHVWILQLAHWSE
jgi:hypothetical protein